MSYFDVLMLQIKKMKVTGSRHCHITKEFLNANIRDLVEVTREPRKIRD